MFDRLTFGNEGHKGVHEVRKESVNDGPAKPDWASFVVVLEAEGFS
jgi:hypothetical protein